MNSFPKALRRRDSVQDGAQPAHDTVVLACAIGDDYDDPKARVVLLRDDLALSFAYEGEGIVSIDAGARGDGYALGENGTMAQFDWRGPRSDAELERSVRRFANPAVAEYGPLRRVRLLGADVVCAGSVGQAYRLQDGKFTQLPSLVVSGAELTIEDLAGTSWGDFIAVTSDGQTAHFDGKRWRTLPVPERGSKNAICMSQDGRYAIAGNDGGMYVGAGDTWRTLSPPDAERDYTGVGWTADEVYFSHVEGIDACVGETVRPVPIAARNRNEYLTLRSGSDGTWCFGGRCVGLISDGTWQVIC